jgi:hypothetical protein
MFGLFIADSLYVSSRKLILHTQTTRSDLQTPRKNTQHSPCSHSTLAASCCPPSSCCCRFVRYEHTSTRHLPTTQASWTSSSNPRRLLPSTTVPLAPWTVRHLPRRLLTLSRPTADPWASLHPRRQLRPRSNGGPTLQLPSSVHRPPIQPSVSNE